MDKRTLLSLTTDIVSSHASLNELTREDLLDEIQNVFAKLSALGGDDSVPCVPIAEDAGEFGVVQTVPAVPLAAAFAADKVFCMVCGKGMKTLKRHLSTAHGLKPGEYRKQFGIPTGTPLIAKEYSQARRKMAQDLNLADGLAKARAARGKKK
ncbi:MAG: MucR family transcriptional regulator [Deferrisomatales bacterium]|nr:MucR family transcriptional regulator [Deferrisomatales bacterium]